MRRIVGILGIVAAVTAVCMANSATPSEGLSADDSLKRLVEGNKRYVSTNGMVRPHQDQDRRTQTAKGQKPFAIILSCADSRVPPELIFDQGIGDLFIVRTAGNIFDNVALGSLEYGAEHLNVPLLVVMGHKKCGAVAATVQGGHAPGHIFSIVEVIAPAVAKAKEQGGNTVENAVHANAVMTAERLRTSEPILAELVKAGKLKIVAAVYDIETGAVEFVR